MSDLPPMEVLRRLYAARLPPRLAELSRRVSALCESEELGEIFDEVLRETHNLSGTAGSYGFAATGEAMHRAEVALRAVAKAESSARASLWKPVFVALDEAIRAVQQGQTV